MSLPQIGDVVLYSLAQGDLELLQREPRRGGFPHHLGEQLPLIVVLVDVNEPRLAPLLYGQVVLLGEGTLWVGARHEGTEPGTWRRRPGRDPKREEEDR